MAKRGEEGLGILIGLGPKPKGEKGAGAAPEGDEGELAAAKGVLKAIERGDAGALNRALKEHYEYCSGGKQESASGDLGGTGGDDY